MKRKSFIVIIAVIAAVLTLAAAFFACRHNETSNQPSGQPSVGPYISFTTSYDLSGDKMEASVSEYNFQSGKTSEIFRFPVSAMYALGVYDRAANRVFYVKEYGNNTYERKHTGDQIYMYDLNTGSERMLTENLRAVNYIYPVNDIVFFLAAPLETGELALGRIDLKTGDIKYWDEPETSSSRVLSIDREKERLYVAVRDVDEEEDYLRDQGKKKAVVPTHTIYSYDYNLGDKREILWAENTVIRSVYAGNHKLLYTAMDDLSPASAASMETRMIDLDTMEVLFENGESFSERGCLSADGAGTYSFASIGDDFYGICYYDFKTREYTPILNGNVKNGEGIINFQIMQD